MFQDKTIVKELTRLVSQLHISDSGIIFREKQYAITPENAMGSLIGILYSECYALKETYQSGEKERKLHFSETNDAFSELLSQNNHTQNKTEKDWVVKTIYPNGYLEIAKQAKNRIIPLSSLIDIPVGSIPETGQIATVFFPKEDKHRQPTFHYVFSNQSLNPSQHLTRIYWNCISEGAPVLINILTKKLNYYNIPFLFKCLNHPDLYFRRDAAVLYIEDAILPIIKMLLPEVCDEMKEYLEQDVPLFAYPYAKGVGIAESPNAQESFGMNRVAILAETLFQTAHKKVVADAVVNEIAAAFVQRGIDPKATFLNKGSKISFN
ncbi:T3SS effector HopA1 family protein [Flavobacterium sp. ENC]|uniref:T3SS effector HopA1 family protein n=1 Tax=Flavobacterium sp. ENC TaxID=2897330 RepID=UPI001E2ADE14|nr:T3SS effector HopA1 family protein [Flavobacterium sp. ENC]MCD0465311.1 T3SS effector HopA1 family protein [Flavobacterium sp. ENC]